MSHAEQEQTYVPHNAMSTTPVPQRDGVDAPAPVLNGHAETLASLFMIEDIELVPRPVWQTVRAVAFTVHHTTPRAFIPLGVSSDGGMDQNFDARHGTAILKHRVYAEQTRCR